MFESFTDEAKAVVADTEYQARSLGHNYIGTEHLLFSLIVAGTVNAATNRDIELADAVRVAVERGGWVSDVDALRQLGIDAATVINQAKSSLGAEVTIAGGASPGQPSAAGDGRLRFTPRTKTVLQLAADAAAGAKVTPQHLLLGLLQEDGGLGVIILDRLGTDPDVLREELAARVHRRQSS